MQGSKILPDNTYAVEVGDNRRLVRFVVQAVIQRRTRATGSPHDYESFVEGWIMEDAKEGERRETVTLSTKRILGPYEEQAELRARKDAEDAERKRKDDETENNRNVLVLWLYSITGLEPPTDKQAPYSKMPFRRDYGGVDINDAGVRAMLRMIQEKGL